MNPVKGQHVVMPQLIDESRGRPVTSTFSIHSVWVVLRGNGHPTLCTKFEAKPLLVQCLNEELVCKTFCEGYIRMLLIGELHNVAGCDGAEEVAINRLVGS